VPARPFADHRVEFFPSLASGRRPGVAGVFAQLRPADGLGQPGEDGVGVSPDDHVTVVGAPVGVGWHHTGDRGPGALADRPEGVVFGHNGIQQAVDGLIERDVHRLSRVAIRRLRPPVLRPPVLRPPVLRPPAPFPPEKGQYRPEGGIDSCHAVAQAHPHSDRRAVRVAGEEPETAHGLGHAAEPGSVTVWPVLAESGQPHQDHFGVRRRQRLRAEPQPFQGPRPEALEHDVAARRQSQDQIPAGGGAQVDGDRPLSPPEGTPQQRGLGTERMPLAGLVSRPWRFHLHHIGAEGGQQSASRGGGHITAELDHPEATQHAVAHNADVKPRCGSRLVFEASQGGSLAVLCPGYLPRGTRGRCAARTGISGGGQATGAWEGIPAMNCGKRSKANLDLLDV
jgi:hypothetical protein